MSRRNIKAHDAFFKRSLQHPRVAKEFFEKYLPNEVKYLLDTSDLQMAKETFVDKHLKKSLSDALFVSKTGNEYVYILIESQSSVDHMMAFRLQKYMLSICEKHLLKKKPPLPIIYPIVLYNGQQKYTASRDVWTLFSNPILAKKFFTEPHKLIDLQAIKDDSNEKDYYLTVFKKAMKHIFAKDLVIYVEDMIKNYFPHLQDFEGSIDIDYITSVICYTIDHIPKKSKQKIGALLKENINKGDAIMESIADNFRKEGKAAGIAENSEIIACNLLRSNCSIDFVTSVTGLSKEHILKLKAAL